MDSITGWAGKMFMKQKMGTISDSLPGMGKEEKADPAKSTRQIRSDIKASRVERDSEFERNKAERGEKKIKLSERWAANKKINS